MLDLAADEADALHIARQDYTPPINECDSCDVGYRYCLQVNQWVPNPLEATSSGLTQRQSGPENEKECRDNTCNLFENCKKCQLCGGPVPISPPPPSALFDKRDEGVDAATNVQCSGPCVRAHNTCLRVRTSLQ